MRFRNAVKARPNGVRLVREPYSVLLGMSSPKSNATTSLDENGAIAGIYV